ncbi:copper resistance CopC family protein [Ornithinimicrobium sufpigmenti]|uniref:copper resistance CopC family protein n=1 Tax=Ornithinimicrobium sufpigmenti TaxID=2508882 RepID=UPI001036A112|nr:MULTISPECIES: copper resistance CopC family protein [unclassified Ornithinimicrobium]
MVRLLKSIVVGLLAALVVLLPGGVALAHDELLSTDPEDGATVQEAPEELVLTFSGQIAQVGAQLQITDADGTDVADGDPVVEGTDLVQALSDVGSGDYEVIWRVTSSDGHPISGTFGFTVEAAEETEEPAEGTTDPATDEATEDATDETTDGAAVEATPDATDEATDEVTEDPTEDATEVATDDAGTVVAEDDNGMPAWVWVVVGVAVLALVALLARTWSRGRN